MATFKTVRVIANASLPQYRTVNIVASGDNRYPTWTRGAAADRTFETVQDSGGTVAGLKTVICP